jgi:hypothetical protein
MAENKTKPSDASVADYLSQIENEQRRKDCEALVKIMTKASRHKPVMWGAGIVGFGVQKYKYASGREGETCLLGFSSRKGDISIYGTGSTPRQEELLANLGKHKMGKGCLYIGKLEDIDAAVLEQLLCTSAAAKAA